MTEREKEIPNGAEEAYNNVLEEIRKMVNEFNGTKFEEVKNTSGSSFFGPVKTRLLKVVKTKSGYKIEFNFEVGPDENLRVLTPEEAKAKHMGTARWIYYGNDINVIRKLVRQALEKFKPASFEGRRGRKKKNDDQDTDTENSQTLSQN